MKWLLLLLFISIKTIAQVEHSEQTVSIAKQEQKAFEVKHHQRLLSAASNNYTVHYARCFYVVDPAVRYITGKVTHYFTVLANTNSISFDLTTQLRVDSVLFRNQKISYSQPTNQTLAIQFGINLTALQKDSVTIFYKGVPDNTGFGSFIQSSHNNVPVIWTLSEPYGSKDWWPCRNGLDDKVDSIDIYITHPSQYKATANGMLQFEQTNGNSTTTFYKHRYPIAAYLVAFSVTNFSLFNHTVLLGNVQLPMISFIYPESVADFQSNTFKVLDAMKLFHTTFGDYPFIKEKYGHTQFGWGGGMEHQTNTFLSSSDANLMAHELGHQWFGNKITCGSWQDIWLNESFATFAANYYLENFDTTTFKILLINHLNHITSAPDGAVFVADTTDPNRIFSGRLSYDKGAFVLRTLRFTLGDSIFFKGLRQYLADPVLQYSFAKTNNFKQHMELASGKDLTYFFNQWIYGEGYPSFKVQWVQNSNNWAKVSISQTTSHSSVAFFKTSLELTFKNATQQKKLVVQCNTNNVETWLNIGFAADTVLVDVNKQLISKNNTTQKLGYTNTSMNELKVYPNPVKDDIWISLKNPSSKNLTVQLYNTLGQLLVQKIIETPGKDELLNIPFSNYGKGNYLIRLMSGSNFLITKKLIK